MTKEEIEIFIEKAEELSRSRYLKQLPKKLTFNISWNKENGGTSEINTPDWDTLKSFAVTFRLFYFNGEPIYLLKVIDYAKSQIIDKEVLRNIINIEALWNNTLSKSPIPFKLNNNLVTPREITNLFIYNDITHIGDSKHRKKLKSLRRGSFGLIDYIFHLTILNLSNCIFAARKILEKELEQGRH